MYKLFIDEGKIEIMDSFTYLDVSFTYTDNVLYAVKSLQYQAVRAYNCLISLFQRDQLGI